ncbi:hypothetical protein DFQ29_007454, partial [Apophysomyces sp. BC1021]
MFAGCQDWINSTKTNHERIQFKSMRPIYELLDEGQREEVERLYNKSGTLVDDFPELTQGIHFDGSESYSRALELSNNGTFFKMIMLKRLSSQPNLDLVKWLETGISDMKDFSSFDIETNRELPGNYGFRTGAEGAYKERSLILTKPSFKKKSTFYLAYVTCKELFYYDEFIQPTKQFKEAINRALQVGSEDQDTYNTLQDVFQEFGYYYPSSVRYGDVEHIKYAVGGRIKFEVPLQKNEEQHKIQKDNPGLAQASSDTVEDSAPVLHDIIQSEAVDEKASEMEHSDSVVKAETSLLKEPTSTTVAKSLEKSKCWDAIGLKPLYKLLPAEQCQKIQKTYENIVIADDHIYYDYLLKIKPYEYISGIKQNNDSAEISVPSETLLKDLSEKVFLDSNTALEFCRDACQDAGFSIIAHTVAEKIVCVYCSHGNLPEDDPQNLQQGQNFQHVCQWGVMLFENDESQWVFRKLPSPEESEHNHSLLVPGRESSTKSSSKHDNNEEMMCPVHVKLFAHRSVCASDDLNTQHVRYGDIVKLSYKKRVEEVRMVGTTDFVGVSDRLPKESPIPLDKASIKNSDMDFLWRIVRCDPDREEDQYNTNNTDDCKDNAGHDVGSSVYSSESYKAEITVDRTDYVRKSDIIAFESMVPIGENYRLYLCGYPEWFTGKITRSLSEPVYATLGWHIQPDNQYEAVAASDALNAPGAFEKRMLAYIKQLADENDAEQQYYVGHAYMYGLRSLKIDKATAMNYLAKAVQQGQREAHYLYGKLLWDLEDYQKSMQFFEEST